MAICQFQRGTERLHIVQTLDFDQFIEEYGSQFRITQLPKRRWFDSSPVEVSAVGS